MRRISGSRRLIFHVKRKNTMEKKKIKMKIQKTRKMKVLSQEQIKLHREIEYIIKRAEAGDYRLSGRRNNKEHNELLHLILNHCRGFGQVRNMDFFA